MVGTTYVVDPDSCRIKDVSESCNLNVVSERKDFVRYFVRSRVQDLWLVNHTRTFEGWLKDWAFAKRASRGKFIFLGREPTPLFREHFSIFFKYTPTILNKNYQKLAMAELLAVMSEDFRGDRFIAGDILDRERAALFVSGDGRVHKVPLSLFSSSGCETKPDFKKFSLTDYGSTIKFGKYEASVEAVLYETDPEFRKRYKKNLVEQDDSLGGAIRRLRLQRGLARSEFDGIPEKTLARIERGEVTRPRKSTLAKIAALLEVPVSELGSY